MKTPADVIARLLVQIQMGGEFNADVWPVGVAFLDDDSDQTITTYDTAGEGDGRLMVDGFRIKHPGVMVRVRGPIYPDAWERIETISLKLAQQRRVTVSFDDGDMYFISNISQRGEIIPMGQEGDSDRRRYNFTLNLVLTLSQVSEDGDSGRVLVGPDGEVVTGPDGSVVIG